MSRLRIAFLLLMSLTFHCYGQETGEDGRLDEKIDAITYQWDLEADKLSSYVGLKDLCTNKEYRLEIFALLNDIHHYDSVLYDVLQKLSLQKNDREIEKTLKDIRKFEKEESTRDFIHFMREECAYMAKIERKSDDTKNQVGANSYSSQIYMLETELFKRVKHITKRIDNIRKHVHHLSDHYQN